MDISGDLLVKVDSPRAKRAWYDRHMIWIELDDGREIGFPIGKIPRLAKADDDLVSRVRVEARGRALRWDELDEDLSVEGIVAGRWPK